jgi:glutamate N-acetyltransferase / amino-acid N-acetyltransferase
MHQFLSNGTVTSVKGFKAAGIHAGIKKRKKDLALIYSETPCTAAGTFTLNKVQAAPIQVSKELIKNKNTVKAVLVNSGNANACTGEQGTKDALAAQAYCAKLLGISPSEVIVSSTGVIGQLMPMDKMLRGIKTIISKLSDDGGYDASEAILTTDLVEKSWAVEVTLSSGKATIGGICKGSGMIMPNMATMLGFITTDAAIGQPLIQELLSKAVNKSFNRISVDGDTSTNDMVTLMANGASGVTIKAGTKDEAAFYAGLEALTIEMAKAIVKDGEGASKLVTVTVKNAKTDSDANTIAQSIVNSPLVKTAIHGCDANWGRIISAAGKSGAEFNPEKTSIYFDDVPILLSNYQAVIDESKALLVLEKEAFTITVDLNDGEAGTTWWTCDFSQAYIRINANYRT